MIKTLRATPGSRGWVLTLHATTRSQLAVREALAEALEIGRGRLLDWYRSERALPEAWRLEVAKSAVDNGEISIGLAEHLARRCAVDPAASHDVSGPMACLSIDNFARILAAHGLRVDHKSSRLQVLFSDSVALITAMLGYLRLFLQSSGGRLPNEPNHLFALHGESSTRTRHLLPLLTGLDPPAAILVLGRPKLGMAALRKIWGAETEDRLPPMVRPWSWRSLIGGLPEGLSLLAWASLAWRLTPWTPPWRERAAQAWRCLLGSASAAWWLEQDASCRRVIFGHTGTADTHLLERAMQASGSQTIHAVHGLSGGVNFIAHSSLAVWRCGADAAWHQALGTYGHCVFAPAECPSVASSGEGVLLLTNLAHPMNPLYRHFGLEPEREAISTVAIDIGQPGKVRWRPHPVSAALPIQDQRALSRMAGEVGVVHLAGRFDLTAEVSRADRILCTPSTVIVDVLLAGRVPEVVGDLRWASHVALRGSESILAPGRTPRSSLVGSFKGERLHNSMWMSIRPARPLRLSHLLGSLQ